MKGKVKFPFRVKYGGQYYAPGATVKVDDVDEAVSRGAEIISAEKEKHAVLDEHEKEKPEKSQKKEQ